MSRSSQPDQPEPVLITDSAALAALCDRLRGERFVTVDTEFMRERTYWPELCVVQLGGAAEVAVVDALAPGLDLAPLGALMADPAVTKVFHACRQDVEIFVLKFGATPRPLFDTQVAAMVAGFGDQAGYDTLVSALTNQHIDKAHRFSDWAARPLSAAQITYAAGDVTWLRTVYEKLVQRLERDGRLEWVAAEMAVLTDPDAYRTDPLTAWERLRPRSNNRRFLGLLRDIAAWREREAQRADIPRQRLLKDEILLELAATAPQTAEQLGRARGISRGFAEGRMGASLLEAIATSQALPDEAMPEVPARRDSRASPALVALLKVLLNAKSEQHHIAPRLLASSEDIERLAGETAPDLPALHGWRAALFGNDALALKAGEVTLGVQGRNVKLVRMPAALPQD
jgi:ribonuclease D